MCVLSPAKATVLPQRPSLRPARDDLRFPRLLHIPRVQLVGTPLPLRRAAWYGAVHNVRLLRALSPLLSSPPAHTLACAILTPRSGRGLAPACSCVCVSSSPCKRLTCPLKRLRTAAVRAESEVGPLTCCFRCSISIGACTSCSSLRLRHTVSCPPLSPSLPPPSFSLSA